MKNSVSHLQAIGFALAGFAFWVLCDTCIKLVAETGLPPYEVAGFMGLSGALIMLIKTQLRGGVKTLWPKNPRTQSSRALLTLGITFCNVIALRHLPLSVFYILAFMAPLVTALLASLLLHEHLDWKKTIAIVTGFAGVVVAVHPGFRSASVDWIGYAAMGAGVLIFAVNAVWLRRLSQTETVDSLVFSQMLAGILAGFVPMVSGYGVPISLRLFAFLFAAGTLDVMGIGLNSLALRHTTAANVAQFHYTQIVTGALIGYLIWNETPTLFLIAGSALIIGSGLYIVARARKAENIATTTVKL